MLPTMMEPLRADGPTPAAALMLAHEAALLQGKARDAKLAGSR